MTSSDAFDDGGVRGAGGLADGLQAEPLAGAFEFAEQVGEHPGSGRAQRVAEGDGAAVDVQLVVRDAEFPLEDQRHTGEGRSEEHTSELQSLMRISYAVFCLKKKKK